MITDKETNFVYFSSLIKEIDIPHFGKDWRVY